MSNENNPRNRLYKIFSAIAGPYIRQAIVNFKYARMGAYKRNCGMFFETSLFPSPQFNDMADVLDYIEGQYANQHGSQKEKLLADSTDRWRREEIDCFSKAQIQFSMEDQCWYVFVQNVALGKPDQLLNGAVIRYQSSSTERLFDVIKALEHAAHFPNDYGWGDCESLGMDRGSEYDENHILNLIYRLGGADERDAKAEMVARKAHMEVFGRDMSPNFCSNFSNGTVLKPNQYHHFYG